MILPIGDSPNPKRYTPWVTWGLIAVNVLIYLGVNLPLGGVPPDPNDPGFQRYLQLLMQSNPRVPMDQLLVSLSAFDLVVFELGYKPGAPEMVDLFAAMFLHSGFAHLAGNMLFLWIYGDNVEHRLGRLSFLLVYLLAGIAATLSFGFLATDGLSPLIGASGAISGVLGLYFLLFPANKVKLLVVFFPWLVQTFLVSARWVLGFYVVFENLIPLVGQAATNVAYGAHLGGFFFGLFIAYIAQWWVMRPASSDENNRAQLHMEYARRRLKEGQPVSAFQHIKHALSIDPGLQAEADPILKQIDVDPRYPWRR